MSTPQYDAFAQSFAGAVGFEKVRILGPAYYDVVQQYAPIIPNAHALDFGAGDGTLTQVLAAFPNISSIDLFDVSEGMLAEARKRFKEAEEDGRLITSNLNEIPKGFYGLAIMNHVLPAISNYTDMNKAFSAVNASLAENGLAMVLINHPSFLGDEHASYVSKSLRKRDVEDLIIERGAVKGLKGGGEALARIDNTELTKLRDGEMIATTIYGDDGHEAGPFLDTYWTHDRVSEFMRSNGFSIIDTRAVMDVASPLRPASTTPPFMMFVARKIKGIAPVAP